MINHRCHVRRMLQLSPFSFWNAIHTAFNLFPAFRWLVRCVAAGPRTIHIVLYPEGLERLRRRQMVGNGRKVSWARRVRLDLLPTIWTPRTGYTAFKGGGELLPMMAYTRRLRPKGVSFQASGIWKGRDSTCWSIWRGREICHLGLWKGSKELTEKFMA